MKHRYFVSAALLTALASVCVQPLAFAQTAPAPAASTQASTQAAIAPDLDYSLMALFMEKFSVVERGRTKIAYSETRRQGKPFLTAYVEKMAAEDISVLSRDGQLAYWLNLQNILVIKAITDDTKKTKLNRLRGTGASPGKLWTKPRVTIDDATFSIVDIENKIMASWPDTPDLIYGLYQGVKGGPCLNKIAFTAANVHDELSKAAKQYINARGIVKVSGGTAHVTPIYDWYKGGLFGADDRSVIAHIRSHAAPTLANRLSRTHELAMVKLNYRVDNYVAQAQAANIPTSRPRIEPARGTGGFGS